MDSEVQEELVRMSIQVSPTQRRDLVTMARRRQISAAALVREIVREFLAADAARRGQSEPIAA